MKTRIVEDSYIELYNRRTGTGTGRWHKKEILNKYSDGIIDKIDQAIGKMKLYKSPAEDDIVIEAIKNRWQFVI